MGTVDNDATLEIYNQIALAQAEAGADVCAPSGMMDGQVASIRRALNSGGYIDTKFLHILQNTPRLFMAHSEMPWM